MTEIDRNCASLGIGQENRGTGNSGTREQGNIENRGVRGKRETEGKWETGGGGKGMRPTGKTREKVKQGVQARNGNRGSKGNKGNRGKRGNKGNREKRRTGAQGKKENKANEGTGGTRKTGQQRGNIGTLNVHELF